MLILSNDDLVRSTVEQEHIPDREPPSSWFSASEIHLGAPDEQDFVVMAEGPLVGGNVITFWVFQRNEHGYRLLLTAPAHDLIVTKRKWKGHREIELLSASAVRILTVVLRFDGLKYKEAQSIMEPIR
ncbi:MAG TPA: hypothetical protein VKZ53_29965 [Candidatus Angelobacter sp.]|nr:hypothetical protein [Candidatus Angelobacter sp.]